MGLGFPGIERSANRPLLNDARVACDAIGWFEIRRDEQVQVGTFTTENV
jgi:hypothetical protein